MYLLGSKDRGYSPQRCYISPFVFFSSFVISGYIVKWILNLLTNGFKHRSYLLQLLY